MIKIDITNTMFRVKYILFLMGFSKRSALLPISELFSKKTITSDIVKKLNSKHTDFSYRIDQKKFGRTTIACARVRLDTDNKSSIKRWFAYKESQANILCWELL